MKAPVRRIAPVMALLVAVPLAPSLFGRDVAASFNHASFEPKPFDGQLDIMTYNVHGLPWPIASGRAASLREIAERLRALHEAGQAPDVVVLQEAFSDAARAIGRGAGYKFVAFGPDTHDRTNTIKPADDLWKALPKGARWLKGEALGKFESSGLAIFSDYPITRVRRMTFSSPLCAGFDCLAAKGAMIVQLNLPGSRRIEVATTHMNSRHASAVPAPRSDLAWTEQGKELSAFVEKNRNPALPLVLGGDFNVGRSSPRRLGMAQLMARLGSGVSDALRSLKAADAPLSSDARYELVHAKDWELSLSGSTGRLVPLQAVVPFGTGRGAPLSDHYGYQIRYAIKDAASGAAHDEERAANHPDTIVAGSSASGDTELLNRRDSHHAAG